MSRLRSRMLMMEPVASGYTPTGDATVKAWYRADVITSLWTDTARTTQVTADGDRVAAETDLSGTTNHTAQGTAGNCPEYKTNIQNGKPALLLSNARNDNLAVTLAAGVSQPFTIYVAYKRITGSANNDYIYDDTDSTSRVIQAFNLSGTDPDKLGFYAGNVVQHASTQAVDTSFVVASVFNGASSAQYVNGALYDSGDAGAINLASIRWGARFNSAVGFHGYFFERLVYSGAHNAAYLANVFGYLNSSWAIY